MKASSVVNQDDTIEWTNGLGVRVQGVVEYDEDEGGLVAVQEDKTKIPLCTISDFTIVS